jgi:hypothetical protein
VNLIAKLVGGADRYPGHPAAPSSDTRLSTPPDREAGRSKVISGLRDSMTYRLAVLVYKGHTPGSGVCLRCGHVAPCTPRGHAAAVIQAAGDDPRWYDNQLLPGRHRHADTMPTDGPQRRDRRPRTDDPPPTTYDYGYGYPFGGLDRAYGRAGVTSSTSNASSPQAQY